MLNGYRIIDADCHVMEPIAMWQEYLEPEFKHRAPIYSNGKILIEGEPLYYKVSQQVQAEGNRQILRKQLKAVVRNFDPQSQVEAIREMGVDVAFLYPTVALWLLAIDTMDPELAVALTRAYNNWLRDFCSYDRTVLKGVAAIALHAPEQMVPELRRVASWGWKAVYVRPNPVRGRLLSDRAYEPFWTECEKLGISVSIHEGSHSRLPTTGSDRFHTRFALHACSHPLEQMIALLSLIEGGVLERHPDLKVAFLEAGCGWLPYWLWRLDEEYEQLRWEVADNVKLKPSEYFRRQCYISVEPSEPDLERIIHCIGTDNVLFSSDYPHMDGKSDIVAKALGLSDRLSRTTMEKILWENPMRYYGSKARTPAIAV